MASPTTMSPIVRFTARQMLVDHTLEIATRMCVSDASSLVAQQAETGQLPRHLVTALYEAKERRSARTKLSTETLRRWRNEVYPNFTKLKADLGRLLLDNGWSVWKIANHFDVDVKTVQNWSREPRLGQFFVLVRPSSGEVSNVLHTRRDMATIQDRAKSYPDNVALFDFIEVLRQIGEAGSVPTLGHTDGIENEIPRRFLG